MSGDGSTGAGTIVPDEDVDVPEIRFAGGLPGFAGRERFALAPWGDGSTPLSVLQSLEDADLSFVVVPPAVFFPDYEPVIAESVAAEIGIESAEDAMLLVIVTVRQPVAESTANLLGPLLVNIHDRRAIQAVLDPDEYSASSPLAR